MADSAAVAAGTLEALIAALQAYSLAPNSSAAFCSAAELVPPIYGGIFVPSSMVRSFLVQDFTKNLRPVAAAASPDKPLSSIVAAEVASKGGAAAILGDWGSPSFCLLWTTRALNFVKLFCNELKPPAHPDTPRNTPSEAARLAYAGALAPYHATLLQWGVALILRWTPVSTQEMLVSYGVDEAGGDALLAALVAALEPVVAANMALLKEHELDSEERISDTLPTPW